MQVGDQITAALVTLAVQEQQQFNSCRDGFGDSERADWVISILAGTGFTSWTRQQGVPWIG